MSFQWSYSSTNLTDNYTVTPGSMDGITNHCNTERLLSEFNNELLDHKKKQNNLIQNFLSSNAKFDEVTQHFMSQINPSLKSTANRYKHQNERLNEEINRLNQEISEYRKEMERVQNEKQEIAIKIINFCESDINPTEFELFVGALFASLGYRIEHNGKTHDGGIDLIVRHPMQGKGVVQVKQYRNNTKVTEPQIRDLFGAMSAKQDVEYSIMVVLSDCTKEAKTWPQRENVTNLKIWTQKELISLLQGKPINVLIEFVKLLMNKYDHDLKRFITNNGIESNNVTPRNLSKSSYSNKRHQSHRQHIQSGSTLSSAKKQKRNKDNVENMQSSWRNFRFSHRDKENVGCNESKDTENKRNDDHDEEKEYLSPNKKQCVSVTNNGEPSPYSSNDSSLFIDECQSDDDHQNSNLVIHRARHLLNKNKESVYDLKQINDVFSNQMMSNKSNSVDVNTNLLWSLGNNINKPRRPRRKWTDSDNIALINSIKQFGINWNENGDQWNKIHKECSFSEQFSLKDIKKHYSRVLKPKLLSNVSQSQQ